MTAEKDGATLLGVPDLNDPNVRLGRAEAMRLVNQRRRETIVEDMAPDDAKALLATPREAATTTAGEDGEDTDKDDAAAAAERTRLEAAAAKQAEDDEKAAADAPNLDPTKQVAAQTEDLLLTDDDLKHVKIKMVINGEERVVTGEEMRREAQKVGAADEYLETARNLLKEVKGQKDAPAGKPATTTESDKPSDPEALDKAVDQLFQGNDAEAKKLFREALGVGKPTNVEQITREIEQRIVIRSALRQFATDHKEITANPYMRRLADQFLSEELDSRGAAKLEDLPAEAIPDVINGAGLRTKSFIREQAGLPASPANGKPANTLSERLKRKETIDELPSAATRSSSSVPSPKTTSDVITQMRIARGQGPKELPA